MVGLKQYGEEWDAWFDKHIEAMDSDVDTVIDARPAMHEHDHGHSSHGHGHGHGHGSGHGRGYGQSVGHDHGHAHGDDGQCMMVRGARPGGTE